MSTWQACLWGLLGSALIEGWDLYTAIHSAGGFPWKKRGKIRLAPYLVAVVIRVGVGAALAAVYSASNQIEGPLAAVTVGIAAPKILEQLARNRPTSDEAKPDPVSAGDRRPVRHPSEVPALPDQASTEGGSLDVR
ncbi:hypothetical protein [Kitasatospora sp. NPDC017646]|uniref:hypothetical protein n=1 Tax=Kitasatospora sp. NPDC017646 TaxID=3364024 RepID=UPI00379299E3